MRNYKGFKLRTILSLLVIGSVLVTAFIGAYLALTGNVRSLSSNYLENNYYYAKKLASNTNNLLNVLQNNIQSIAETAGEGSFSQKELDMMYRANEHYFNSIVIVDPSRRIKFVSPGNTGLVAERFLTSDASLQATTYRELKISEPYVGTTGRLIIMISAPIYNDKGIYMGFVGGTIYLQDDNVLSRMLGEHYYGNGSYVYVVDSEGRIIYHPEDDRVNEIVINNTVINKVISGKNGSDQVTNSMGTKFLAGYAYEPISGWGVISQTPISVLEAPIRGMIWDMLKKDIPLFLIILFIALGVSRHISQSLHNLVKFTEGGLDPKKLNQRSLPKNHSNIYEVKKLHKSMGKYLDLLNQEIKTDGLTGLANRKTFDLTIQEWFDEKILFSLVFIDIDYFKLINDEFGHTRGDEALKYVAAELEAIASADDLCFRYGGEEFGILVKYAGKQAAIDLAETLRKKLATSEIFSGQVITISIGIAFSCTNTISPKRLVEMADAALYQSKNKGRNRTTVYSDEEV